MFPLMRAVNQVVLDWIVMYIIDVIYEVLLVFNPVLPESSLPYAGFTVISSSFRDCCFAFSGSDPKL